MVRVDPVSGLYEPSPWQGQLTTFKARGPKGMVAIAVNAGDRRASGLATGLAASLRAGGVVVRIVIAAVPAPESAIRFRFGQDAPLAQDLAGFLPGFTADRVSFAPELDAGPGEVVVNLVLTGVTP